MAEDDFDILGIFKTEASQQLQGIVDGLLKLEKEPPGPRVYESLMRYAHTLKGAARAVQFNSVKEIAHRMEDLFNASETGVLEITPVVIDQMLRAVDLVRQLVDGTTADNLDRRPPEVDVVLQQLAWVRENPDQPPPVTVQPTTSVQEPRAAQSVALPGTPSPTPAVQSDVGGASGQLVFQVRADVLDRMLRQSGELKVIQQLSSQLVGRFNEYIERAMRLASQIETLGFHHAENIEDSSGNARATLDEVRVTQRNLQDSLVEGMQEVEHLSTQLFHTSNSLDEEIVSARLKTLSDVFAAFPRMVRDLAREHDKEVDLKMSGEDVRIDKAVLDVIRHPMLHLLRNAVAHGIEPPAERKEKNKPAEGLILISARQSEGQIYVEVEDDGRGIDEQLILREVIAQGRLTEEIAAKLSHEELIDFLFLPGFSTANKVDDLSGRGVGLDVVKSEVENIGGNVHVHSVFGKYTRFSLEFPITISLTPSLLVSGGISDLFGEQIYLLPVNQVVSLQPVMEEKILLVEDRRMFHLDDQMIPICQLAELFDIETLADKAAQRKVVVIGTPGRLGALIVERILDEESVIVQPCDPRLGKIQDISGTAALKNGKAALMMDVHDLLNTIYETSRRQQLKRTEAGREEEAKQQILIVEDSVTVRELTKQALVQAGFAVLTAVDGQDGLNKFQQNDVDLVISDIDMPQMNGFEMVRAIRSAKRRSEVPVIMLSYKERDEDRNRAFESGANHYMTKADFDKGIILETISSLLNREA